MNTSDDEDDPHGQSIHSQFVNSTRRKHSAKSFVYQPQFKQQNHRVKTKYKRSDFKSGAITD
jgi:hypothetical protein